MRSFKTSTVFTPSTPAINAFVTREAKINKHLRDALHTPGKQIVLYGHSGCGKTTLIIKELTSFGQNYVTTQCMAGMTFDSILMNAFEQLGQFFIAAKTIKRGIKLSPEISLEYKEIKTSFKLFEASSEKEVNHKPIIPPQLTPQTLGKFFGEAKCCWILEDFHKITGKEKSKTSQVMKVFMDLSTKYPELKLIAIGAVGTARQVIEYDSEMNNRVSEIYIPFMKDKEIEVIIETGEDLLNVKFIRSVKDKIIQYSCGLPANCHQICLNMCFNDLIYDTGKKKVTFDLSNFEKAVEKLVEEKSDTLKAEFDRAIKVPNNSKGIKPKDVLQAALGTSKDEFSFDEVFSKISVLKAQKKDVENILTELCTIDRSEILVHDENSNKYRFNNLFTKSYVALKLIDEDPAFKPKTSRDEHLVDRILELIERDLEGEDFADFYEDEL